MLSSFQLICAYKPDTRAHNLIPTLLLDQELPDHYSAIETENIVSLRPHTKLAAVALTSSPHLLSKMVIFGSMVVVIIKFNSYFTAMLIH